MVELLKRLRKRWSWLFKNKRALKLYSYILFFCQN